MTGAPVPIEPAIGMEKLLRGFRKTAANDAFDVDLLLVIEMRRSSDELAGGGRFPIEPTLKGWMDGRFLSSLGGELGEPESESGDVPS